MSVLRGAPIACGAMTSRADRFKPLPPEREALWKKFGRWETTFFPQKVGLELEEVRQDYSRMRLPYSPELRQPAGVVHGGAIATLIDTVVVPAIGAHYDGVPVMLTIDMQLRYLGAARETDLIAEGWITRRGRSVVFCQAEVLAEKDGSTVAEGWLTYQVRPPEKS